MFDSIRKFIRAMRRREVVAEKPEMIKFANMNAVRANLNFMSKDAVKFRQSVKRDQQRGILRTDGSVANMENRWVRIAVRRNPKLMHDPFAIAMQKKSYPKGAPA